MKLKYDKLLSNFALDCNLRHYSLAQYSDRLYTQSEERLNSPEWAQSEKLRARNEEELANLKKEKSDKRNLSKGRAVQVDPGYPVVFTVDPTPAFNA